MRLLLSIITFSVLNVCQLKAQNDALFRTKRNAINVQLGVGAGFLNDRNFSPLNYATQAFGTQIEYQRNMKNEDRFFVSANFYMGDITTHVSGFNTSDRYNGNINIGYLTTICQISEKCKLGLGGQINSYIDAVLFNSTDALTYYGLHSFDLMSNLIYPITPKHSITTTLSLPLFGYLVRPPYCGIDKKMDENEDNPLPIFFRGKWTTIDQFFAFRWNLQYMYAISNSWNLIANYEFGYHRTNQPAKVILPDNHLKLGIQFKF